ncbi:capsule polysaccharide transporter [termite gut metagenome]|uniref:Capsule polysaccharide transporter n=1 Tax=termite gut metagenome TaxID=433724 RepID=A0A5J4SYB6_9ZZZZ
MHRYIILFLFLVTLSKVVAAQQMSDNQVIEYVKDAYSKGKSQNQTMMELIRLGVNRQQIARIQEQYGRGQAVETTNTVLTTQTTRGAVVEEIPQARTSLPTPTKNIFGHDIFTTQYLTFEPNNNLATPDNYILGTGDEVIINVWGDSETSIRAIISPQGNIQVERIGPIYLSGQTVKEANNYLQREFEKIYSGLSGNKSQVKLTLGEIRTVQINIMGEVLVPGTYRLSSFSSVFHALYSAGGVTETGSLRNIQVMRKGKKIADIDVYKYIFDGKVSDDIRLIEGDVIIVPAYDCLVNINGKIKKPMYYEMKKGETVDILLSYAGGFTGDAYRKSIQLTRSSNGIEKQIYDVEEVDYAVFKLHDEDELAVQEILDRYENRVIIRGAVYRPGTYPINGKIATVKQLIDKAEGLQGDAFLDHAQLQREHEDFTLEIIPIDIKGLINNTVTDILLQRNDVLYIPSIHDIFEDGSLAIHGEIAHPGTYIYTDSTTIEDLIIKAGGLLDAASSIRADVSRRIKDPKSNAYTSTIGQTFSFELKDGLIITDTDDKFTLQPYDEVYVRRSPGYQPQQNVTIIGEVLFGGNYALTKKTERLSDLIKKAGGITPDAYVKGARLLRKMAEEEIRQRVDVTRLASQAITSKDSIKLVEKNKIMTYTVGIDLERALQQPGSYYDLVLREGDQVFIPEYINTVKIDGAVMYPNTVSYVKERKLGYYINQAGGYNQLARKNKAYAVYLNGTVTRLKGNTAKKIEPGCEIIIPNKEQKDKMTTAEYIGMGTSFAALATMIATIVNILK